MLVFEDRSLSRALDKTRRALGSQALILRVESVPWGDGSLVRVHAAAGPARTAEHGDASRETAPAAGAPQATTPQRSPQQCSVQQRSLQQRTLQQRTLQQRTLQQRTTPERERTADTDGRREPTIALVGPPGAGKSTAAVKLARHLEQDRSWESSITHLTGDDPRLEELVRAAGLELDLAVDPAVSRPSPIARIIDTPGVLPDGSRSWQELMHDLRRVRPRLVHLVLPASTAPDWAAATIERWREAGVNRLLITQIEAVQPTRIVHLVRASGLRLSFLGHGASVEEDLIGRRRGDIRRYLTDGEHHAESYARAA